MISVDLDRYSCRLLFADHWSVWSSSDLHVFALRAGTIKRVSLANFDKRLPWLGGWGSPALITYVAGPIIHNPLIILAHIAGKIETVPLKFVQWIRSSKKLTIQSKMLSGMFNIASGQVPLFRTVKCFAEIQRNHRHIRLRDQDVSDRLYKMNHCRCRRAGRPKSKLIIKAERWWKIQDGWIYERSHNDSFNHSRHYGCNRDRPVFTNASGNRDLWNWQVARTLSLSRYNSKWKRLIEQLLEITRINYYDFTTILFTVLSSSELIRIRHVSLLLIRINEVRICIVSDLRLN